ncbi:MAG: hypothetical protein Q9218_004211 [Villophora microphyllina]
MTLPLEIRRLIWDFALPTQDLPLRSPVWTNIINTPNHCMNLLAVNKEVSEEAREVQYDVNAFTATLSCVRYDTERGSQNAQRAWVSLPASRMLQPIKHWQVDLRFAQRYYDPQTVVLCDDQINNLPNSEEIANEWTRMREAIFCTSDGLSKLDTIQSLKLKFGCACVTSTTMTMTLLQELISQTPQPLRMLHVQGPITFIAARMRMRRHNEPRGAFSQRQTKHDMNPTEDTQCQKPQCLALAACINLEILSQATRSPPTPFDYKPTGWQRRWLGLKNRAAFLPWDQGVQSKLHRLWFIAEWLSGRRDMEFEGEYEECCVELKREIRKRRMTGRNAQESLAKYPYSRGVVVVRI